jgi:hypothetical protein
MENEDWTPVLDAQRRSDDRVVIDELVEALKGCQAALAMMIEPNSIERTTLQTAFAQATEAEAKARAAIAKATS